MSARKFLPTNVGAEPKKLALLGGLVIVLAVVFYMNSGPSLPPQAKGTKTGQTQLPTAADPVAAGSTPVAPRPVARTGPRLGATQEWIPTLKVEEDFDLSKVDPTLDYGTLEKVRAVGAAGGRRSLFEFFTPPPPPPPKVTVVPTAPKPVPPPPPTTPTKSGPPPAAPIPLKFYGYAGRPRDTDRRAFFIDGEEIFIAGENDLIRSRYRVIRINVNSAEVEDTVSKSKQTLQIVEPFEK